MVGELNSSLDPKSFLSSIRIIVADIITLPRNPCSSLATRLYSSCTSSVTITFFLTVSGTSIPLGKRNNHHHGSVTISLSILLCLLWTKLVPFHPTRPAAAAAAAAAACWLAGWLAALLVLLLFLHLLILRLSSFLCLLFDTSDGEAVALAGTCLHLLFSWFFIII